MADDDRKTCKKVRKAVNKLVTRLMKLSANGRRYLGVDDQLVLRLGRLSTKCTQYLDAKEPAT